MATTTLCTFTSDCPNSTCKGVDENEYGVCCEGGRCTCTTAKCTDGGGAGSGIPAGLGRSPTAWIAALSLGAVLLMLAFARHGRREDDDDDDDDD